MPLDLKVVVQQIGPRINPDGMEEHWQRRGWRGIGWFMEVPVAERGGLQASWQSGQCSCFTSAPAALAGVVRPPMGRYDNPPGLPHDSGRGPGESPTPGENPRTTATGPAARQPAGPPAGKNELERFQIISSGSDSMVLQQRRTMPPNADNCNPCAIALRLWARCSASQRIRAVAPTVARTRLLAQISH